MAIIKIRNAAIDLDAAEIPNLSASKITSGTFADARIADLSATKLTGSISDARLPANALNSNVDLTNLSASNLTSGTIPTARITALPAGVGGKVLQVVQKIDTTDRTTTSSTYTSGIGGALQIQPSATSSKILIMASVLVYRTSATGYLTLAYQGSSLATNGNNAFAITDGNSRYYATSGMHFLHSPNTTNLVSYDVLMKTNDNTSPTVQCANNYAQAVLTLMEIAG